LRNPCTTTVSEPPNLGVCTTRVCHCRHSRTAHRQPLGGPPSKLGPGLPAGMLLATRHFFSEADLTRPKPTRSASPIVRGRNVRLRSFSDIGAGQPQRPDLAVSGMAASLLFAGHGSGRSIPPSRWLRSAGMCHKRTFTPMPLRVSLIGLTLLQFCASGRFLSLSGQVQSEGDPVFDAIHLTPSPAITSKYHLGLGKVLIRGAHGERP